MAEIKHIALDKCFLNLFVRPVDKKLVVEICLFGQSSTEVDRILETSSVPVGFK